MSGTVCGNQGPFRSTWQRLLILPSSPICSAKQLHYHRLADAIGVEVQCLSWDDDDAYIALDLDALRRFQGHPASNLRRA